MIRQDVSTQPTKEPNGVYAFDLKLNVDFNSGHLSVNVPPQAPFSKKMSTPVNNCAQSYLIQNQPIPQYIPIQRQQSHLQFNSNKFKGQIMQGSHPQTMSDKSYNHQQKYAESLNTTTFRLQQPPSGVQCVICQKVINQGAFSLHLEQHRNRRKNKQRSSLQESDFSIRNKNEHAQIAQLVNHPQSFSFVPNSLSFSQSNDRSNPHHISNQSNTIVFPIMAQNNSNQIHYSRSQTFNNNMNFNNSESLFLNNTALGHQQPLSPTSFSNASSQRSYTSNQISIPSNQISSHSHQTVVSNNRVPAGHAPQRDLNVLQFNRIQSMIIRQQNNRQNGLQQCGQSRISSRNSLPTKYSQIYALQQQLNHPKSANYDQESSSQDDESLKVYGYKSARSFEQDPKVQSRSNMTQKLSKTKLPLNYLARQEFITSSTHSTMAYKSKHIN